MMDDQDASADARRAQAAQWLARLRTLPVSKDTLDAFFDWRRDPANAQAFAEAETLWGDAGRIAARPAMLRLADAAMKRKAPARRPWRVIPALMLAAGLVAALLGANWRRFAPAPAVAITTAIGERRALTLEDGSQLAVNTDTRLDARLGSRERRVRLDQGEALFTVAHDPARPFIVTIDALEVRAIGTRFDVRRTGAQTRVALFEGSVDITQAGRAVVRLRPGQQWRSDASAARPVQSVDARTATAWTQGRVVFDATPLDQAVAEINRYSAAKVMLVAPGKGTAPISGSFVTGDQAAFAQAVSAMLGLVVERRQDGGYTLRAPAPPGP